VAREGDGKQGGDRFLFPKWTNRLRELSAILAIGGLIYVVVILTLLFGPETSAIGFSPEQPVPYNHALHVSELGLDCRYCHNTIEDNAHAAIPPAATCMNCHSMVKTTSEDLAPVRQSFEMNQHATWQRVHDLPDFVYFNHSAHVSSGVSCLSCHGRIDRMELVRQEEALTMQWCLQCHREPDAHLRPRELVTKLDWSPPNDPIEMGRQLREAHDISPSTDCSVCHR